MIKTNNIAKLTDQNGVNDVEFEVNYDKDHKEYIKVTLNGKISVIKKDDLWNLVFSIVKKDQQDKMVPVIKTEMISYLKQHTVELQKDMKKGETVVVHCQVNVKKEVDDAMRREIEDEAKLSTPTPYLTDGNGSV